MMMRRMTVLVTALALCGAGCAQMKEMTKKSTPPPMVSKAGVLKTTETITYVGVDFTETRFYDPYFQYDDIVKGKVPSWSQRAYEDEVQKFPTGFQSDLTVSAKRNAKIRQDQFATGPFNAPPAALGEASVRKQIEPYVDRKAPAGSHGLVIVAEQLNKGVGVVAHWVVFDRRTGDIVLMDQVTAEAGGFGPHNYYLNGLKGVAKKSRAAIAAAAS